MVNAAGAQACLAALGLLLGAQDAAGAPTKEQAIQRTLAAIRKELQEHGGGWEKWAESVRPYRQDIQGYVTNWQAFKWPWPAKREYVFQGSAVQLHLRDELEELPEGERPLESILHLDRQLRALGTDLIVAFIPSKLSVHPDCLYAAAQGEPQRAVRAPEDRQVSLAVKRLMCRLLEGGVEVVDLHEAFRQFRLAHGDGVPLYYVRDSHFLNRGARLAAGQIAERLRRYEFVQAPLAAGNPYTGEKGSRSDGTKADDDLLLIKDRRTGEFYKDAKDSPVVVGGDSHLLYNDGKAQVTAQIAHQIGLPVSRLGREGLSGDIPAQLARDPMLRRRRVVVLLYSERALAPRAGRSKWPIVDLPGAAAKAGEPLAADRIRDVPATCVVVEASPPPDTKAPYRHYVMKLYVKGLTDQADRPIGAGDGVLHVLAMHNRKVLAVAKAAAGSRLSVRLTAWPLVEGTYGAIRTGTLPSLDLELDKPSYWAEVPGEPRLTAEELGGVGEEDAPEAGMAAAAVAQAPKAQPSGPEPAASLAEPPLWPIGLRLSDKMVGERAAKKKDRPADLLIWTPPGAQRIRAMMIVPNNTDSKNFHEHAPLREVAARREVGMVYLRAFYTGIEYHHAKPTETPPAAPDNILKLLEIAVGATGMSEFRHAPWITFGKSSRGEFPFRMGWLYPERTIAGISYHGETPTWPIPKYARKQDQTILYVNANGQEEWSGTWYRHVRPSLLNYRANTAWLPHQVVGFGVGHGNYVDAHGSKGWGQPVPAGTMSVLRIWDYLTLFVDKALALRLPEKGYPTDGPLKLRQVDPMSGYLIHPRAIEELLGSKWMAFRFKDGEFQLIPWPDEKHPVLDTEQGTVEAKLLIRKAADVPEAERSKLFWVADRELVEAWLKLHNVKGKDVTIP